MTWIATSLGEGQKPNSKFDLSNDRPLKQIPPCHDSGHPNYNLNSLTNPQLANPAEYGYTHE